MVSVQTQQGARKKHAPKNNARLHVYLYLYLDVDISPIYSFSF